MLVCVFAVRILHARPRVQRAPGLPCALCFEERMNLKTSGASCRETVASYSVVIVREGGRSSIPETAMIETMRCGVLDAPPSRGMTISSDDQRERSSVQHPLVTRAIKRKRRHVDLEPLAAFADHLIAPAHEARRGRQ